MNCCSVPKQRAFPSARPMPTRIWPQSPTATWPRGGAQCREWKWKQQTRLAVSARCEGERPARLGHRARHLHHFHHLHARESRRASRARVSGSTPRLGPSGPIPHALNPPRTAIGQDQIPLASSAAGAGSAVPCAPHLSPRCQDLLPVPRLNVPPSASLIGDRHTRTPSTGLHAGTPALCCLQS